MKKTCLLVFIILSCQIISCGLFTKGGPFRSPDPPLPDSSEGWIYGHIIDAETGSPIIGACIRVTGMQLGAVTEFDGRYVIKKVPPGKYTLWVTSIMHSTLVIEDVYVEGGQVHQYSGSLEKKVSDIDKVLSNPGF